MPKKEAKATSKTAKAQPSAKPSKNEKAKADTKEKPKVIAKAAAKPTGKQQDKPTTKSEAKSGKLSAKAVDAKSAKDLKSEVVALKDTVKSAVKNLKDTVKSAVASTLKAKAPSKVANVDTQDDEESPEVAEEEIAEAAPKAAKAEKVPKVKKPKKSEVLALALSTEETRKWNDYKQKYGADKASSYSMSQVYENHKPLKHDKLGWGYIVNIQNDRLEVLFETGTKILISNYKPA